MTEALVDRITDLS